MERYLYDPHVHTSETSRCGRMKAAEVVERYIAAGFSGLVVTDHLYEGWVSTLDCREDWQACVDLYLAGYRAAVAAAAGRDFDALLGAELRFPGSENDYLIYGVDEAFLRRNPYLYRADRRSFFRKFGGEILIVQAHPFRAGGRDVDPRYLHGIETINANLKHQNFNDRALALARAHPHLLRLCGSDTHRAGDEGRGGVLLQRRAGDSAAFKAELEAGRFARYCPGEPALVRENER